MDNKTITFNCERNKNNKIYKIVKYLNQNHMGTPKETISALLGTCYLPFISDRSAEDYKSLVIRCAGELVAKANAMLVLIDLPPTANLGIVPNTNSSNPVSAIPIRERVTPAEPTNQSLEVAEPDPDAELKRELATLEQKIKDAPWSLSIHQELRDKIKTISDELPDEASEELWSLVDELSYLVRSRQTDYELQSLN